MAFRVSPGVTTNEINMSNVVPNVDANNAAIVGAFSWGSVEEIVFVDNEDMLVDIFGKPTSSVYKDFMCAASFLAYASNLVVIRVVGTGALNATATASAGSSGLLVKNRDTYDATSFSASTDLFIAKNPGTIGNDIGVAFADTTVFNDTDSAGDYTWAFHDLFTSAPASAEFHIVVYDATGDITGTVGTVLEKFEFVSTTAGTKYYNGTSAYVNDVVNNGSAWLWIGKTSLMVGGTDGITLAGGADGSAITAGNRATGWDLLADSENIDVAFAIVGGADTTAATAVITNIAEVRKDCVAFVSPQEADVVAVTPSAALVAVKNTRTSLGSSSYAFMDSAYKLMYDRYNDVNRWVPLNGDTAGLAAKATNENDAWWSPAGYERGRFKNCIKLSYVQSESIRDELYKVGINPCINVKNQGPMLFGDKTLLSVPSAFDRIGVRRLFIVLEKSIATAAKYQLFNFNDAITRAKFVNMVDPFLDTVKARRGLTEKQVVCDTTNNTEEVIARNEFVASIWILPNYSINYITLNFVAVNSRVMFTESVVRV